MEAEELKERNAQRRAAFEAKLEKQRAERADADGKIGTGPGLLRQGQMISSDGTGEGGGGSSEATGVRKIINVDGVPVYATGSDVVDSPV